MRSLKIKTKTKRAENQAKTKDYCTLDLETGGSCQKFGPCMVTMKKNKTKQNKKPPFKT